MAKKAFEIQGSDLNLGGVVLQAGATAVVIPGVTQAANYRVEEVEDNDDVDQTYNTYTEITVIDAALYHAIVNELTTNNFADYVTELDDDGYIDEIEVGGGGTYTAAQADRARSNDMYAYIGTGQGSDRPLVPEDWIQIPFRPKMRAGEVENVGGGSGNGSELVNDDKVVSLESDGTLLADNNGKFKASVETNDVYSVELTADGINTVWGGEDTWSTGAGPNGGSINASSGKSIFINTDDNENNWEFGADGNLTFPDGTIQTTAYTGQTSGSASGELYIMANTDGDIVTSTNGVDWIDPQSSGMSGIGRVEIHGGVIVYINNGGEGPSTPGLYYSTQLGAVTLCVGTSVSVETGNSLYWNEVHYFSGTDKWVAVGYNAGDNNNHPVLAHSDDGITWTVVFADNTFVEGFNPGGDAWQLRDVAWLDETNQYVITSALDGELFGGIFLTADITTALDGSNHVAIDLDADHVAPWSVEALGGPPGYVALIPYGNDGPGDTGAAWFGFGSNVQTYDEDFEGGWTESITNQIGYLPSVSEVAYRNGNYIAVTTGGHVITPADMGFAVSVPVPYTNTSFTITNANPAVITWNGEEAVASGEMIVITGAGDFNGTFYVDESGILYTDSAFESGVDSTGFAAFASGGTVTFSHGQYFDAAGVSNSYYYIGNDDEKIFRSSNGITWTEQADFTGEYFNDFAYGTFGTSTSSTAIPNTKRGWINLVGDRPNNESSAYFESVVTHGGYAYVLGGDSYIDNSSSRSKVYKFDLATGEQVWVKQITAGRGAQFNLIVDAGVVTIDSIYSAGVGYKIGEEIVIKGYQLNGSEPQNNVTLIVGSIDVDGGVETASVKPGYDVTGLTSTLTGVSSDYDDAQGDACAIAYDEYNQKLVVVTQYESGSGDVIDNNWVRVNVYTMNPTTGAIDSTTTISEDGDVYANSISTHNSAGGIAIVGEKYNEYRELGVLEMAATYNEYFDILKTELDEEHYPGAPFNYYEDFWITGTGITGQQQISYVNHYTNLATTVRQGSGAIFDIADNGDGTYLASGVQNAGTNYRVGHKILVLGTDLGGATPANDCTITVDSISEGGVIFNWSVAGTAAGSVFNIYGSVTGTNYNTGSGAAFNTTVDPATGAFSWDGFSNQGSNYVAGDVLTIAGTAFAGGTSPANDATLVVDYTDGIGAITGIVNYAITGTGPTNTVRIQVNGVNFTVGGEVTATASIDSQGGYNIGSYSDLTTTGGTGTGLTVNATATGGYIGAITIVSEGNGYTTGDTITLVGGDGFGCTFTITANALGAWSMRQNLGGEAFVWTPDWCNAIGGPSGDRFYDVCWEDAGTALYAVGRGRYETAYDQALVVKYNASTGAVIWSKDIKFSEATDSNREARAVCLVPGSTDIIVAGGWYNDDIGEDELILTRMTDAGGEVWQKTYSPNFEGNNFDVDYEIGLKSIGNNIVLSFEQSTDSNSQGLAYIVVDPSGTVVRHRVVSSDGNSNYNYYDTPTANWSDVYTDENLDQYIVMAAHTYVPTDSDYNALLMKLPLDGLTDIAIGERWSIGEHIMSRHAIGGTTVTSAFDSFTPTEHVDTMTNTLNARNYTTRTPDGELHVWTHQITDDAAGYLEFGDGSKQSFATNIIPQIPAANDYWLTTQDSGKHIFFEHENGAVYIPHSSLRYFPVGFVFTIVNTTGGDCYLYSQDGEWTRADFKLAGRNLSGTAIGIPDSGSGSMVTVMKIKDGYEMNNSDNDDTYPDIWIVSGPGDLYLD